jgi:hypothetical protein
MAGRVAVVLALRVRMVLVAHRPRPVAPLAARAVLVMLGQVGQVV